MYPLQILLVNCPDTWRGHVRRELGNHRALVKAEFRDVVSVLQRFYQNDADQHFLMVMYIRNADELPQLQRLSAAFPNQPILALRDRDSDQSLFLGALRAGAAFAVPVPLDREDLGTALNWIARQFGYTPPESRVVAVAGVNGGCGATSVALNLAYEIGCKNKTCLLIELAQRMGMLATCLHLDPKHTILDAFAEGDNLDLEVLRNVLTVVNDQFAVLPGPQQAIHTPHVPPAEVLRVLTYARPLADVIVVDVFCTYDDLYFDVLAAADHIVLLWEQKIPSARALQMVRDALHRRQIPPNRVTLVLNRYDPRMPGFGMADLQKLLGVRDVRTIANDWAAMSEALNAGRPLRLQAPKSRALADISALADEVLGLKKAPQPAAHETTNLFGRMVRAFGLTS